MTQSTDRADAASKHCRATCPAARAPQMAVPADGKISVSFSAWDVSKFVLEDQAFEASAPSK